MLNKAIYYGKEKRKPYRGSKAFDRSCRHGGGCMWCENNRTFNDKKRQPADLKEQLEGRDGSMEAA